MAQGDDYTADDYDPDLDPHTYSVNGKSRIAPGVRPTPEGAHIDVPSGVAQHLHEWAKGY